MVDEKKEAAPVEYAVEYPLEEPIKAYNEEVKILKLRKPNGGDLVQVGNPVIYYPHVDPPKVEFDMVKMVTMLARLSNIPSSSIQTVGTRDLMGLAWMIAPFFIPAQ